MTNDEIFDILRPIVMDVTKVPECILADETAPSPSGPYATIRPKQAITEHGQAIIKRIAKPGALQEVQVRAQIVATCSINFFRGEAQSHAEKLKQANKRPNVSMELMRKKLGWRGTDAVNNLTALQSNNYEQRAQINIYLYYESFDVDEINTIENVPIAVQYEDGTTITTIDVVTPDTPSSQ